MLGNRLIVQTNVECLRLRLIISQKKSLAQTGKPGNVNQGASTIPLFQDWHRHPDEIRKVAPESQTLTFAARGNPN